MLVQNYGRVTDRLIGVKCRATLIAKNRVTLIAKNRIPIPYDFASVGPKISQIEANTRCCINA